MSDTTKKSIHIAKLRLDWAGQHINVFEQDSRAFITNGGYAIVPTVERCDDETSEITYRFKVRQPPPTRLRFLAGDAVHNLRATVDNLLWGIGQLHGAPDNISLKFPNTSDNFVKYCSQNKVERLPQDIQRWIEAEQQHLQPNGKPSLLGVLNRLWSRDKHRAPVLVGSGVVRIVMSVTGEVLLDSFTGGMMSDLDDGDIVAVAKLPSEHVRNFKVKMIAAVCFEDSDVAANVFLRSVERHIRESVLPRFERC